jgi:hypothetical protein
MSRHPLLTRTIPICLISLLVLLTAFAGSALAQIDPGNRVWISTDGSAEGTPAEVRFDAAASNPSDSFFDVFIHGFFVDTFTGPENNLYKNISVPWAAGAIWDPGILPPGPCFPPGSPALPGIRFQLAIATGAQSTRMEQSFFDVFTIANFGIVAPEYEPELDAGGTPARFVRDETIYAMQTPWPASEGSASSPVSSQVGSIMGATPEVYPFHWNPSTGELAVYRHARYHFSHTGTPQTSPALTKERVKVAAAKFNNWGVVNQYYLPNLVFYTGDYLFITAAATREELAPLITQKSARGFKVEIATIPASGNTCASIRNIILAWYYSTPAWRDHYCLMVGDTDLIPLCTAPTGAPTDDLYGSTNGNDLDEEVYVGRLSIDSEADCANQVAKILAYEDSPQLFCCYDQVLLAAHKQGAPGKYVGAHESVRLAAYAVPPSFSTLYGNVAGVDNADVSADINAGLGLVAYRGHGSETEWWEWDLGNQSYDNTDVGGLTNAPRAPVVWSFACDNAALNTSDCIAEAWMEQTGADGAVSHYGATIPSGTAANHELDRRMFKAVYDLGLTTQSQAIEYAEDQMSMIVGSENAWMYLLLGDPDMQIRRRNPMGWVITTPLAYPICANPPCHLDIVVKDQNGNPLAGLLVGAYKAAAQSPGNAAEAVAAADEVFDNRYTDATGLAHIPAEPSTTGRIDYTVQDDQGNSVHNSIPVTGSTGVEPGAGGKLSFRALPTVTHTSTYLSFGMTLTIPARVTVHDVTGRAIRTLEIPAGASGVAWDGRDNDGRSVRTGVYMARLGGAGLNVGTRIMMIR